MDASGRRVAIVVSRWNELITRTLLEGALDELERLGAPDVEVVHVPGTWEIPAAAKALLDRAERRPDAIVALGCILQGETPHAGLLASDVGSALMGLQTSSGVPIAWGVLTPVLRRTTCSAATRRSRPSTGRASSTATRAARRRRRPSR